MLASISVLTPSLSIPFPSTQRVGTERDVRLNRILTYPFSSVKEKVLSEGSIPEEIVDEAIDEFRRYLILIHLGYRGMAMCSKYVDEVWHAFILHTRDYAAFCESVFGTFLHHEPGTIKNPISTEAVEKFVSAYQTVFGEVPLIWNSLQRNSGSHEPQHSQGKCYACKDTSCKAECEPTTNCQDKE